MLRKHVVKFFEGTRPLWVHFDVAYTRLSVGNRRGDVLFLYGCINGVFHQSLIPDLWTCYFCRVLKQMRCLRQVSGTTSSSPHFGDRAMPAPIGAASNKSSSYSS